MIELIKTACEDVANCFGIKENLFDKYVDKELLKDINVVVLCQEREIKSADGGQSFPLGGPGTVLNGFLLYSLMRHFDFPRALETGVSGGFYTCFLIIAAARSTLPDTGVLSIDISEDEKELGKLITENFKARIDHFNIVLGQSSLDVLPKVSRNFQLYSHDSLHTLDHMLKELEEFKKCSLDRFIVFIDDQNSEGFWDHCLQNKLFDKEGYGVKYISGKESRLNGHIGGFVLYQKLS